MKNNLTKYLLAVAVTSVVANPVQANADMLLLQAMENGELIARSAVKNPVSTNFAGLFSIIAGIGLGKKAANLGDKAAKALIQKVGLTKNPNFFKNTASVAAHSTLNCALMSGLEVANGMFFSGMALNQDFIAKHPLLAPSALITSGLFAITLPIATLAKCIRYAVGDSDTEKSAQPVNA